MTAAAEPGAGGGPGPAGGELELQRRWAAGCWERPGGVRLAFAGSWNRGPGPDFRGAVLLDGEGRARRGDVELHLLPSGWRAHGHDRDPAYEGVVLHAAGSAGRRPGGAGPPLAVLPAQPGPGGPEPPCGAAIAASGAAAVEAMLRAFAMRRLERKIARQRALAGRAGPERAAEAALARAIGAPRNGAAMEAAALARDGPGAAAIERAVAGGWRRGRGRAGTPRGAAAAFAALLERWRGRPPGAMAAALRIAAGGGAAERRELRLPGLIGPARAARIAGDFALPVALAAPGDPAAAGAARRRWASGPETRHRGTAALRERLDSPAARPDRGRSQALLELERGWCSHGACAICPMGALGRPARGGGDGRTPVRSLNAALSELRPAS